MRHRKRPVISKTKLAVVPLILTCHYHPLLLVVDARPSSNYNSNNRPGSRNRPNKDYYSYDNDEQHEHDLPPPPPPPPTAAANLNNDDLLDDPLQASRERQQQHATASDGFSSSGFDARSPPMGYDRDDYGNDDRHMHDPSSSYYSSTSSAASSTYNNPYNANSPPLPSQEDDLPPPPPKYYEPIHYNFPKEKKATPEETKSGWFGRRRKKSLPLRTDKLTDQTQNRNDNEEDDIPQTFSPNTMPSFVEEDDDPLSQQQRRARQGEPTSDIPEFASPRRDIITRYQSTLRGKLALAASSGVAGSLVGAFLGKSILNKPGPLATAFCGLFVLFSFLRNAYAELVRALGMALILVLQRTSSIRRRYPTWRHVHASIGATSRRPFPPTRNPWTYKPRYGYNDPEFKMLYTLIAMAFIGSTCGGSLPLIPTWLGSLAGAGIFALSTTMQSARGDLARTMGMRVVALVEEFLGINSELKILQKGGVVSGKILDKIFILDRKHRIKDRLIAAASFAYRQVSNQVNRVQSEMQQKDDGIERGPPRRRESEDGPADGRRPPPRDFDEGTEGRRPPPRDYYDDRRPPPRDYQDRRPPPQ